MIISEIRHFINTKEILDSITPSLSCVLIPSFYLPATMNIFSNEERQCKKKKAAFTL
jgi:hypothetical protein